MDFGKVNRTEDLAKINLKLPPLEERSLELLTGLKQGVTKPASPQIYVGCPLWGQKEWVGKVYPPKTQSRDYLKYYSKQFNSIELNTTFYRIPDLKTVQQWRQMVPSGFKFCPKFFQGISHENPIGSTPELAQKFAEVSLAFEETLGLSFFQLPQSFDLRQMPLLWKFMESLPRRFPLSIEFRHPSWFSQQVLNPQVYDLLQERGVASVITDTAGRRDVLHGSLTSGSVMVRFVGNKLHQSDYTRLDEWVVRLGQWLEKGLQKAYFFVHQPDDQYAPELITYFIDQLNLKLNIGLKNWVPVKPEIQFELF